MNPSTNTQTTTPTKITPTSKSSAGYTFGDFGNAFVAGATSIPKSVWKFGTRNVNQPVVDESQLSNTPSLEGASTPQDNLMNSGNETVQNVSAPTTSQSPQSTNKMPPVMSLLTPEQAKQYYQEQNTAAKPLSPSEWKKQQERMKGAMTDMSNKEVPTTGADASTALDTYFSDKPPSGMEDTVGQFMSAYSNMNPIEANIFQGFSDALSSNFTQQSLTDFYKQEVASQGIEGLNIELADINKIMEGTEDDIRDEITAAGGFATESQVAAMTGARNKTLLKRASYLTNILAAKEDYVDRIVSLTQADRKQVSDDIDRKLGIGKTIFDMQQTMKTAAKENVQSIIKNVGYAGLVDSIGSKEELEEVSKSLGMSPKTLLGLSKIETPQELEMELAMRSFQLSQDKFDEDKRQFGLQYALGSAKLAQQDAAKTLVTPYRLERSQRTITMATDLLDEVNHWTTGAGSLLSYIPGTDAADFAAKTEALSANIFANELTAMREASKTGGAVGNVSDREGDRLASSLGALSTAQSPRQMKEELNKVIDNIYSWNSKMVSMQKGAGEFDYDSARVDGYSNEEIMNYVNSL